MDNDELKNIIDLMKPIKEVEEFITKDLTTSGFSPDIDPPIAEPRLPKSISYLADQAVKDLYDNFLIYYEYLTDQITQCLVREAIAKETLKILTASLTELTNKNKDLTNAEARKNWTITHPLYIAARRDLLYFETLMTAQEERRKKMAKSMDRVAKELYLRTKELFNSPEPVKPTTKIQHSYKPTIKK